MKNLLFVISGFLVLAAPQSGTAQVTGLSGWNIYLDPGHSQTENTGIFGYSEAEKNLRVGLELRRLLLETTDIDTVYISRTSDLDDVDLSQRTDHANSVGAAWFHSIHSDAAAPSVNSTLLLWAQLLSGAEKDPPGGQAMSDIMVDRLTRGMRISSRGSIGDCSFYGSFQPNACSSGGPYLFVNRNTTMPSELSEAGFHTNPTQNTRNMNVEWKHLEAKTFFWTILDFHGINRPAENTLTGFVRDIETGGFVNGAVVSAGDSSYTTDTFESLFDQYSNDPDELHNGFYYLQDMPGATVSVTVDAENYLSYLADVSMVDTFFTFHDIELVPAFPPAVATSSPEADSTHRVIDPVVINFNRIMDRPSVEAAFSLTPDVTGSLVWANNDFRVSFVPDSFFSSLTEYTVTISESAEGIFGDGLDGDNDGASGGDFVLNFETGFPDVTAPAIEASYPAVNEQGIERDPIITVVYNEHIAPESITDDMFTLEPTSNGSQVPGQFTYHSVGPKGVISYYPDDPLKTETWYRLTIDPGVRDVLGNEETAQKFVVFRTGELDYTITDIDGFDGDLSEWWVPQQSGSTTGIVTDSTSREPDGDVVNLLTGSSGSMKMNYGWDVDTSPWLIRTFLGSGSPAGVQFDSTYTLQAYVFGDGSGNQFRFAVDDNVPTSAAANHEVSPWFTVDWYGWRLVSWRPSRDGVGSWLGDGSVDGTTRFDSIQLTHVPGAPAFGRFYVDDLRIAKSFVAVSNEPAGELPDELRLYQNYPNPFSRSTTIEFGLSETSDVSVTVYNMLGAEVARLVQGGSYPAGKHHVVWDATGLSSDVYLVRLRSGGQYRTVEVLLVK